MRNFIDRQRYQWRYLAMQRKPLHVQEKTLFDILHENRNTEYGKEYAFSTIKTIQQFQEHIPEVTYPDIAPLVERIKQTGEQGILTEDKVIYFATSSGTTSEPKFIPVTKKRMKLFKKEFGLWFFFALKNYPWVAKGKTFYIAATQENGRTKAGIPHGNISGYLTYNAPKIIQNKLVIPASINNIKNFDKRMQEAVYLSLREKNITMLAAASPAQLLIFFEELYSHLDRTVKRLRKEGYEQRAEEISTFGNKPSPAQLWPNVSMVQCIKSETHALYLDQLIKAIGKDVQIRDPGILASEARLTLGLTPHEDAGIICANENFYEFKLYNKKNDTFGKPITIDKIRKGKTYQVLVTTPEGLYRYNMGDMVRVIDFKNKLPIVQFAGRDKFLQVAEEHAPESEIIKSVETALQKESIVAKKYTVAPYIAGLKPRYELLLEPATGSLGAQQAKRLAKTFDKELRKRILTYDKTREGFGFLLEPIVSVVATGGYDTFEKARLAQRGQAKPVQVSDDPRFRERLQLEKTYL